MDKKVGQVYGNKIRVRACGICFIHGSIVMVDHAGITDGSFWSPPGGGVEFGDSIEETLIREFREETGLIIQPQSFLFGCEYIAKPIHSIELFYKVDQVGGILVTGKDPEIQIIRQVTTMSFDMIRSKQAHEVHGMFRFINSFADIDRLSGMYSI